MINHPLTILQRMPAFAKPGLIHRNPPVQVGEGTCQVQRRQPVLIRYQIREVSGSRRTGATLLFLADPKPLPASSPPHTHVLLPPTTPSAPPASAATHSKTISSVKRLPAGHVVVLHWQLAAPLNFCQQWALRIGSRASNFCGERKKCPSKRLRTL